VHNSRTLTRPLLRLSGLAAAATAGIIGLSAGAGAGTTPGNPVISAVPHVAAAASAPQTVTEAYSCDTSVLRPSQSAPSPGDLDLSLTLTAPATGIEGTSANVTLGFPATPLASGVSADIPALDSITLSGTGPVNATAGPGVALRGSGGPVTANPAELPAVTATGTLPLTAVGTTAVAIPPQIRVNLSAGGKVIAGLICGGNEGEVKINVTAAPTPPPVVVPPTGPVYTCTMSDSFSSTTQGQGSGPIPFVARVTGHRTTGSTDRVSVGVDVGSAAAALGGSDIAGTAFSAVVPVTGAGHGSITVKGATNAKTGQIFAGSGSLFLRAQGIYRIWAPKWFTFTAYSPRVKYGGKYITISSTLSCALSSKTDSVLSRLAVTGKAVPVATPGSGGHGETSVNGAVPAGAPNTGGGPRPGSDLPMVFGGAALLLLGGGGIVYAARRRRLGQPAA